MKRILSAVLALFMLISLCSCGKEQSEPIGRDCGLYISIEPDDLYAVSCGTDSGSESFTNADGSAIASGTVVHFDFAGDAAEKPDDAEISYFVCVYDKDLNIIAEVSLTDNFGKMAQIRLTVTKDHQIIREGELPTGGAEILVDFKSMSLDKYPVTVEYPVVSVHSSQDVTDKIKDRVFGLTTDFTEAQAQTNYDAYTQYLAGLETDEAKAAAVQFHMTRGVSLGRCDMAAMSFRFSDIVVCGAETDGGKVFGLNFDTATGEEIAFSDLSSDTEALKNFITEDILIKTTEEDRFTSEDMAFIDGYTSVIPTLIGDGNWYFGTDGLVIIVNAGLIAPVGYGGFEFTVSYDELTRFIDEKWFPAELEGDGGSIEVVPASAFDSADHTLVREADDAAGVMLCATGNVYNINIRDFNTKKQIFFCSDLTDGAVLPLNIKPVLFTPSFILSYTTADGEQFMQAVSLGAMGEPVFSDFDLRTYKGNIISAFLPYSADINGDGSIELIDLSVTDTGSTLTVSSGETVSSYNAGIVSDAQLRLRDMDGDGMTELFLEGVLTDGSHGIYVLRFDSELLLISGENALDGYVKEFRNEKLIVSRYIKMLGTYKVWSTYVIGSDGLIPDPDALTVFVGNSSYLTAKVDLKTADGGTVPAGTQLLFTATDGAGLIYFVTDGGTYGSLKAEINEAIHWSVNGIDEVDCFDGLPY